MNALHAYHQNPHDAEAVQAVDEATDALKEWDAQAVPPTTGELLGAEGSGLAHFPGQAIKGLGNVLEDIGQGHLANAGKSVIGGLEQGIKGLVQLPAAALGEATGTDYSKDELLNRAKSYGGSTGAVAAMAGPGAISRFKAGGLGAAIRGMPETAGAVPGMVSTAGDVAKAPKAPEVTPPDASPASSTPPPPFEEDMPIARKSQWPKMPVSDIDSYLNDIAKRSEGPQPGVRPGEQIAPMPGTGGQGMEVFGTRSTPEPPSPNAFSWSNNSGFTTPEMLGMMALLGTRLGTGSGILNALKNINYGRAAADVTGVGATGAALSPDSTAH